MAETRSQRRIRLAIESRGFTLKSLDYERADGGLWVATTVEKIWPNSYPGNEVCGASVEECLADIDRSLPTQEPCGCSRPRHFSPLGGVKGMPSKVGCHDHGCRWHIHYRLRWWTEHGPDWSGWKPGGSWADGEAQKPTCLCGFKGTPEECERSRAGGTDD
jgi:hypothetical protein